MSRIDQNSSSVKALILIASLVSSSTEASPDWTFEKVDACPGCLSDAAEATVRRTVQSLPLEFSRCLDCGLIYQTPRLARELLSSYFSSETFIQDPNGDNLDELLGYPDYRYFGRFSRARDSQITFSVTHGWSAFWRGRPWFAERRIGETSLAVGSSRFWIGWVTRHGDKCARSTCRD